MEARKMVVRGVVRAHQATAEDQVSRVSLHRHGLMGIILIQWTQNMREQRNNLGQAFGTKKAKKALASVTENAISARKDQPAKLDAAAQAMIASMAKDTEGMATRDELAVEADASKPRPKANLNATDIKDVYTIENLIGVDILKVVPVLDWQQAMKAKKEIIVKSEYVANRIQKVSTSPEKLRILRYLLLLIDLNMSSKSRFGNTKTLPKREEMKRIAGSMPEAVIESVRREFSTGGVMSKYQTELLTTRICALACLIDNYNVDIYDLQADLRLDSKGMQQYFREIGAKIGALPEATRRELGLDKATAAQRKVAKLKLPLEFPKVPFARRTR
jgi:DNA-directed RNA polymerase I subunit RPA49